MSVKKTSKLCGRCSITKPLVDFGEKVTAKDGKQIWCKECTREYYNKWRKSNRNKAKRLEEQSFGRFYTTIHGRAVHMLNNAKRRAKQKGLECELDVNWIEERLMNGLCEVTGIPLIIAENGGKGHVANSFSPSIDRIEQNGPYSKSNCRITCWIYNRARGAFPPHDFDILIDSLAALRLQQKSE